MHYASAPGSAGWLASIDTCTCTCTSSWASCALLHAALEMYRWLVKLVHASNHEVMMTSPATKVWDMQQKRDGYFNLAMVISVPLE